MQPTNRHKIRSNIYHLVDVKESKQFRKNFPEFSSYSLQFKVDLKAILDCLEAEPEAVAAVLAVPTKVKKVLFLSEYKFNKRLAARQSAEDYIKMMSDLNQEIVNECQKYAQYFRSKKL